MNKHKKTNSCEQTIYEFQDFNFTHDGYKHMGVVRRLFKAVARIRNMSKAFSKELSEREALDKLIEAALAYRLFLNQNREKL